MTEWYDVVIIGGGPAGSATALTLTKRHPEISIAMVESSHYEKWRVGETLSPDAGKAFRDLEIWDSFLNTKQLPALGICAAWENKVVRENEFIFHPEGKGWHLNRVQFDQWMANEAVKKGTTLFTDTKYVKHEKPVNKKRTLTLQKNGKRFQVQTGFVIDASGRSSSFVKNENGQKKVFDRLSGSIGFFKANLAASTLKSYTLVETAATGWWYSALLPNKQIVIAHMTDADILKKNNLSDSVSFCNLLKQTLHTKQRVHEFNPTEPIRVLSAATMLSQPVKGGGWLAVGDAASTFDPLSSQGIYKGIRSGMFGAYAISDALNGDQSGFDKYERFIQEEFEEYIDKQNQFYQMVQQWPQSQFWQKRQMANLA